jgi:hypothetical protein
MSGASMAAKPQPDYRQFAVLAHRRRHALSALRLWNRGSSAHRLHLTVGQGHPVAITASLARARTARGRPSILPLACPRRPAARPPVAPTATAARPRTRRPAAARSRASAAWPCRRPVLWRDSRSRRRDASRIRRNVTTAGSTPVLRRNGTSATAVDLLSLAPLSEAAGKESECADTAPSSGWLWRQ